MLGILKKASDLVNDIAKWIMFAYVIGVTILAIVGVVFRMANMSLSWNEELMRWFLIGIGYIGASVALKERSHIGIEYFIMNMNSTFRKIAIIVGYLAIITFLMVVLIVSWQASLHAQRQYGSILRVQMIWVKLNLPVGSLFMLIHMIYFSVGILTEKEETRDYVISGGHEV